MSMTIVRPTLAVLEREVLKLLRQRGRLLSSMVRPLLWLLVIGAGFGAMQGASGRPGYQAFLVPGVLGMTLLFGAMLAALSTVYDKESGVMRMLVIAPVAHYWIALAKALGAALAALIQALLLLALLALLGYVSSQMSLPLLALGLFGTALACASLGMLVAAWTRTLDNYATVMNLVIFPVFFLSGSLYPVQHLPPPLRLVASVNPFTHGVDLLKQSAIAGPGVAAGADFSLGLDLAVLIGFSAVALLIASVRLSRDSASEPLVHRLARKQGE
jgi:ABC-2 type transport system permease protein